MHLRQKERRRCAIADRNPKSIEAEQRYAAGERLIDIAETLGVPPSTVRRWKSTQHWDGQSAHERSGAYKLNARTRKKMVQDVELAESLSDREKDFCLYYAQTYHATNSYIKSYGCTYESARRSASDLLAKPKIQQEVKRLKEIKRKAILLDTDDIVAKQMEIAFADLSDYVEWGRSYVPVMGAYGPVEVDDGQGGKVALQREINDVRFRDCTEVDGTLIAEVKVGRDGASLKLADRQKALQWLSDYFMANPLDRHKVDYDNKRLEIEQTKIAQQHDSTQQDLEDVSGIRSEVFGDE